MSVPKPHQLVAQEDGLHSWRPAMTSLSVTVLPGDGRLVRASKDGVEITFKLDADQALHLARLLCVGVPVPGATASQDAEDMAAMRALDASARAEIAEAAHQEIADRVNTEIDRAILRGLRGGHK
jgi:hypothetical protein